MAYKAWTIKRKFTTKQVQKREGRKEGNVLFNDALNTLYLWLYGVRHMVKDHLDSERENTAVTWAIISDYMQRVLLYAPSNRQDSTYDGLCYTNHGVLAGMRNSSMVHHEELI